MSEIFNAGADRNDLRSDVLHELDELRASRVVDEEVLGDRLCDLVRVRQVGVLLHARYGPLQVRELNYPI